jgi:hypothetical protein
MFLKQYVSYDQSGFKESLDGLLLICSRPDASGVVVAPDYAITLTQTFLKLYQQKDKRKIDYQRGAIVELLVRKLIKRAVKPLSFRHGDIRRFLFWGLGTGVNRAT